ncbi:MAG: T9SS type A sorting domain-containing protein [Lentimicrobium sp.]|jgi:hypothetical protein|nr:T9SS type A sorting domain-containing protein [Lentimicrobium sp.]
MKKSLLTLMLIAAVFATKAQNFSKEYPFWTSGYENQFVYPYPDEYVTVGIKALPGWQNPSIMLIRTDLKGDTLYTRALTDTDRSSEFKRSEPDLDGCHYLTFRKNDSVCLARFSPDWDLLWIRKFSFTYSSVSLAIKRNNEVLVAGNDINYEYRLQLYCLSSSGNIIWQKSIITQYESPLKIMEFENGDICIPVQEYHGYQMTYYDLNIYYFSTTGDSLSYTSVPLNGWWPEVRHIVTNNDTLAIIYASISTQGYLYYLMLIGKDGNFIYEKEIKWFDGSYGIYSTLLSPGHSIVATGIIEGPDNHHESTFIYAMTFNGDSLWCVKYGDNFNADVSDLQLCPDGGYIVSGNYGSTVNRIVTLLKTDSLGNLNNLGTEQHFITDIVSVYPNPANEYVVFEMPDTPISTWTNHQIIFITDLFGRPVEEVMLTGKETVWDTHNVMPGIYFFQYNNDKRVNSGKFLILK